jgi:hypothetical protein
MATMEIWLDERNYTLDDVVRQMARDFGTCGRKA